MKPSDVYALHSQLQPTRPTGHVQRGSPLVAPPKPLIILGVRIHYHEVIGPIFDRERVR